MGRKIYSRLTSALVQLCAVCACDHLWWVEAIRRILHPSLVQYEEGLLKFEDINVAMQLLERGSSTVKCQQWAYRAVHYRRGGCVQSRQLAEMHIGTTLESLISVGSFVAIPPWRQRLILELMQWTQMREKVSNMQLHATERHLRAQAHKWPGAEEWSSSEVATDDTSGSSSDAPAD